MVHWLLPCPLWAVPVPRDCSPPAYLRSAPPPPAPVSEQSAQGEGRGCPTLHNTTSWLRELTLAALVRIAWLVEAEREASSCRARSHIRSTPGMSERKKASNTQSVRWTGTVPTEVEHHVM